MDKRYEITVRCNSCTAINEVYVDEMPDEYEQYGTPHCDIPAQFSCCECGRVHFVGTSVTLLNTALTS